MARRIFTEGGWRADPPTARDRGDCLFLEIFGSEDITKLFSKRG